MSKKEAQEKREKGRKPLATDKQKPPGKRGPQSRAPSFSHLTFDEMVDIALKTKPKKKCQDDGTEDDRSSGDR